MTSLSLENIRNVKSLIQGYEHQAAEKEIVQLMCSVPHSPVPHNLYGILLEEKNKHIEAMKHFRAAYALDPTYIPARYNMERYGSLKADSFLPAYSEEDCVEICRKEKDRQFTVEYDEHNVGHIVRKLN